MRGPWVSHVGLGLAEPRPPWETTPGQGDAVLSGLVIWKKPGPLEQLKHWAREQSSLGF